MRRSIIILDVDGTLYPLNDNAKKNYEDGAAFISKYLNEPITAIKKEMDEYGILPYKSPANKSITAYAITKGIPTDKWNEYRNKRFDISHIGTIDCASLDSIEYLCKHYCCVIVSSNSRHNVNVVLNHIGISSTLFDKVISIDDVRNPTSFSKYLIFEDLIKAEQINAHNAISIGDRFHTDIQPILSLGGKGLLLTAPPYLEKIVIDLKEDNLGTCNEYTLYE